MEEFSLQKTFQASVKYWWFITTLTILGGLAGFIFHTGHPEVYQATATYYVTIDVDQLRELGIPNDQYQYNEDLALSSTQMVLRSTELVEQVVQTLAQQGITTNPAELIQNSQIERKHAFWELQYFHPQPEFAILYANTYAQLGYQAMLNLQTQGEIVDFVIFTPPALAEFAQGPVIFERNSLILASSLIGFLLSLLVVEFFLKNRL